MRILLFLFLMAGLMPLKAQEPPPTTETEAKVVQEQSPVTEEKTMREEKAGDKSNVGTGSEVETPDTFDPTEKLSEDFPVAFPVDI